MESTTQPSSSLARQGSARHDAHLPAARHALRRLARRGARFARSALAGAAATLTDLGVLAVLVGLFGVGARVANVPALLAGAVVQFVGNRHFAFRARHGSLRRQLFWFCLVELVTLGLNGLVYDFGAARLPLGAGGAVALRAVVSATVFLGWSYPMWKRVFRTPAPGPTGAGLAGAA
ncbi:MAG: GtrA family protein [Myxococcales bacterium]|nr:GtrA family protein [Myxococcales bacterium]